MAVGSRHAAKIHALFFAGLLLACRMCLAQDDAVLLVVLTVLSLPVGFLVLPSVHTDFTAQGRWNSICRAAGVPSAWYEPPHAQPPQATSAASTGAREPRRDPSPELHHVPRRAGHERVRCPEPRRPVS